MEHDETEFSTSEVGALARRIDRPVVLVGMMGAGKSSVGKRLAQRLGLPFADADGEIESAAGMTIPEIFAQRGSDTRLLRRRVRAWKVTPSRHTQLLPLLGDVQAQHLQGT